MWTFSKISWTLFSNSQICFEYTIIFYKSWIFILLFYKSRFFKYANSFVFKSRTFYDFSNVFWIHKHFMMYLYIFSVLTTFLIFFWKSQSNLKKEKQEKNEKGKKQKKNRGVITGRPITACYIYCRKREGEKGYARPRTFCHFHIVYKN